VGGGQGGVTRNASSSVENNNKGEVQGGAAAGHRQWGTPKTKTKKTIHRVIEKRWELRGGGRGRRCAVCQRGGGVGGGGKGPPGRGVSAASVGAAVEEKKKTTPKKQHKNKEQKVVTPQKNIRGDQRPGSGVGRGVHQPTTTHGRGGGSGETPGLPQK